MPKPRRLVSGDRTSSATSNTESQTSKASQVVHPVGNGNVDVAKPERKSNSRTLGLLLTLHLFVTLVGVWWVSASLAALEHSHTVRHERLASQLHEVQDALDSVARLVKSVGRLPSGGMCEDGSCNTQTSHPQTDDIVRSQTKTTTEEPERATSLEPPPAATADRQAEPPENVPAKDGKTQKPAEPKREKEKNSNNQKETKKKNNGEEKKKKEKNEQKKRNAREEHRKRQAQKQLEDLPNAELYDWENYPNYIGPIKRIQWDYSKDPLEFAREIAVARRPVVLLNAPASKWKATKWTPEYVCSKIPLLYNVYEQYGRVLWYEHPDRPWPRHGMPLTPPSRIFVNMTCRRFMNIVRNYHIDWFQHPLGREHTFRTANASTPGVLPKARRAHPMEHDTYYSYTHPVSSESWLKELEPDLQPRSVFSLGNPENVNLWMGSMVTTHTHFDPSFNFYYQLMGKKRFVIFHHEEWKNIYTYPSLHKQSAQSQVDPFKPDFKKFPKYKNAKVQVAVLAPGEMLFLPAYWFHRVTALNFSMSINIWSTSWEGLVDSKWSDERGVPTILTDEDNPYKISGTQGVEVVAHFIRKVVKLLLKKRVADKFVTLPSGRRKRKKGFVSRLLLHQRYRPLYNMLNCSDSDFDPQLCPSESRLQDVPYEKGFAKPLKELKEMFMGIESTASYAKETIVANFIERVAMRVTGARRVCIFFRCLAQPQSWPLPRK